jgi:outer membrane protein TolC
VRLLTLAVLIGLLAAPVPSSGQDGPSLTLADAIRIALESSPEVEEGEATEAQAEVGIRQARAGYLPRVSYTESFQRSDNPVFVFGSLLNQGIFSASSFDIPALNDPAPLSNFRSAIGVEQTLFDGRRTRAAVRAARAGRDLASTRATGRRADVLLEVVQAYFGAVLAGERLAAADQAVRTAESDLARARAMLDAGMTTQADVLSVEVFLAETHEAQVRARHEGTIAHAALGDAMGVDLDRHYVLTTPLTAPPSVMASLERYETDAVEHSPALRAASLGRDIASARTALAQGSLWPSVVAQGSLESHRDGLFGDGQSSWLAGVALRWDLWSGSNRAAAAAARHADTAANAARRDAESQTRLAVRRAYYELESARERAAIGAAALAAAEASHRIVQNRYGAGLVDVTELIRSQAALLDVRVRRLGAVFDWRVARAALEHAAGNLSPGSDALR